MNLLITVTTAFLLTVSTSANAWRDDHYRDHRNNSWNNNGYYDGRHDGRGNTSGDGAADWDSNIQFDVQMRGSGDAEGYVHGNLGEGWDSIEIHRYDNNSRRSDYIRNNRPDYRDGRWSHDNRRPYNRPVPYDDPYYRSSNRGWYSSPGR